MRRLVGRRRRLQPLEPLAHLDELTAMRNQRALWRELERRTQACTQDAPLTLVMADLDLFQDLNMSHGRAVGDEVLRRTAGAIRAEAPSPRLCFRSGGEEFILMLPETTQQEGHRIAESIRARVASQNGSLPSATVSCGVVTLDCPTEPWLAIDRADAALRGAKRAGRDRVQVEALTEAVSGGYPLERLEHETARRAALAVALATLEARDELTADHSDDVLTLCEAVGKRLGFEGRALERLVAGAQLHDVGKVGVPSQILSKPEALNADEWAVIREHTIVGERILRSVPEMAEVATIVRHSHEHWDGSGYPDGLAGEEIPLASRVILCADAFHAMRSDRPYRAGRTADDALAELRACAGRQFDPAVVAALVEVADELRANRAPAGFGLSLPRSRRLAVLLLTLAIGGGTAYATSSQVRDAVRWFVDTVLPGAGAPAAAEAGEFSFGPLGDFLSVAPVPITYPDGTTRTVPRAVAMRLAGSRPEAPGGLFRRTPSAATREPSGRIRGGDASGSRGPGTLKGGSPGRGGGGGGSGPATGQPAPGGTQKSGPKSGSGNGPAAGAPAKPAPKTNPTREPAGQGPKGHPHGGPPATGNPHGAPPATGNPHGAPPAGNLPSTPPANRGPAEGAGKSR